MKITGAIARRVQVSFLARLGRRLVVLFGSLGLALLCFLVLPLIQAIHKPPVADRMLRDADTSALEPPPPPPPDEPEPEDEPEDKPPELTEEIQPLDLSQLELALNPGVGGGWMEGDFGAKLNPIGGGGGEVDALFSLADLDQKPRVVYQPSPRLDPAVRRKAPGTVYVIFVVDQQGRVQDPKVQRSTDPVFERPALSAVRKWRFEPGKKNGKSVRFRMRVPITFPEG